MITGPIVVGVDGSPESGSAASVGWTVARAAGVGCQLVHAAHDASASLEFAGSGVVTESLQLALLTQARAAVGAAVGECVPSQVSDSMVVSTGGAADVLDAVVAETDASLLVLGGKHHSRLGRWLGGSTVQNMVRRVNVPLLVTAGELPARPRIMVAVDQSYAALPAVRQAVAFARLLGSPLRALHEERGVGFRHDGVQHVGRATGAHHHAVADLRRHALPDRRAYGGARLRQERE